MTTMPQRRALRRVTRETTPARPAATRAGRIVRRLLGRAEDLIGITLLALVVALAGVQGVFAHEFEIGAIEIEHPWARATPPGARVGGGYLVLENGGDAADRLVGATATVAERVEIHEMSVKDGVMVMRPVSGGLEVPAGGAVKLAPGGYHLMLMGLKQPLVAGDRFPGTLTFEHAGTVAVEFVVEAQGAAPKSEPMGTDEEGEGHVHGQ